MIRVLGGFFFVELGSKPPPPVNEKKSEKWALVLYWLAEFRGMCLKYERVGGEVMDRGTNSLGEEFASHEDAS